MRILYFVVLLFLNPYSQAIADSRFPSCVHIASDQDGDGFGFENSATCIVDASTLPLSAPNACVDDNADGYGWNGIETCFVPIPVNTECEDTSPVGDGWGWNGSESCRVIPPPAMQLSELELLKSKLTDVPGQTDRKISAFYCPATNETVLLKIFGSIEVYNGDNKVAEGVWTTGMYDKDNWLGVGFTNRENYPYAFATSILLEGNNIEYGFPRTQCNWLVD